MKVITDIKYLVRNKTFSELSFLLIHLSEKRNLLLSDIKDFGLNPLYQGFIIFQKLFNFNQSNLYNYIFTTEVFLKIMFNTHCYLPFVKFANKNSFSF